MKDLLLGKDVDYDNPYSRSILTPISRFLSRDKISKKNWNSVYGFDLWNLYEVSCLDEFGKPMVFIGQVIFPISSEFILESKSVKLYLNSLNNRKFKNVKELYNLIRKDFSELVNFDIELKLNSLNDINNIKLEKFNAELLDNILVDNFIYNVDPSILELDSNEMVSEKLYSNLLKSNCLITNQPDWGSVFIEYEGKKINKSSLLSYIISYRNTNEFHEQCVERIFSDIMNIFSPKKLSVYAKYTRRGGIDINPYRSNMVCDHKNLKFIRDLRQ